MAITTAPTSGWMGPTPTSKNFDTIVVNDTAHKIYKVVVHRFRMGDVEDPDLYAAQPLWEWQESEMGKWVTERAVDTPEWHRHTDHLSYHLQYAIVAKLKDVDYTFWTLKWGNDVDRTDLVVLK